MTYSLLIAFLLGSIAEAIFTIGFCFYQDWRETKKELK